MFFTRLYERRLAQASYIVGCQATGHAIVIDPNRDIAQYIAAAAAERLKITHVTETHIHADFVSGARELAAATKAQLLLSGEGGTDWQYGFAESSGARVLHDGDKFAVGRLTFDVMHTPGHTPEHLSFVLTDVPASPHPVMIFTGDFVFVGDVGRPDLLERAANQKDTMADSARALWKSLDRFRTLPEHLQLQPGHGAGSACGKALGAVPSSTVGYEKLVNWAFAARTEREFVDAVLEGQPEPPAYFARMKRVNREGPETIGELTPPPLLTAASFAHMEEERKTILLDVRPANAYASGHVPGAINVPLNRSFTTYAGSVVNGELPVVLITADDGRAQAGDAARELALIGVDVAIGFIPASSLTNATEPMDRVPPAGAIARRAAGESVFDVRNASELVLGRVPGAVHIPFPQVVARISEFPRDKPFLVMCQTGARSAVATSVLQQQGFAATDAGGIVQWARAGGAVEG